MTPIIDLPRLGTIATGTLKYRESRNVLNVAAHADASGPIDGGTDLNRAISSAVRMSRADNSDPAHAIMQARDGKLAIVPLNTVVGAFEVDLRIDGSISDPFSQHRPDVAEALMARKDPRLLAIVGAYSWLDFRSTDVARRSALPKLS